MLCAAALGAGYLLGRHAPAPATDTSATAAPASPTGPLPQRMSNTSTTSPRSTPSVASTKTPLPPKGTPLKQTLAELQERAAGGDADAASRLARDLNKCTRIDDLKRTMPRVLTALLEDDYSKLSEEDLAWHEKALERYQKDLDFIRGNEALCAGIGHDDLQTMTPALLRAAQLGDLASTNCYLGLGLFRAPGLLDHPEWLTDYKLYAQQLVQSAFEQGDWAVVGMLEHAYAGFFGADFLTQLTGIDPAAYYRYLRLQRLGANGDFVAKLDKQIAAAQQDLTPQQITDGDAWAQDAYARYFNGSSSNELSNGVNYCNALMEN